MRICFVSLMLAFGLSACPLLGPMRACCPVGPTGKPVVNADQTVIILWDAPTRTQHFIRQASFKSAADDFGFLVPTPSQPKLDESGNEVFTLLRQRTEPERKKVARSQGLGCGCGEAGVSKGKDKAAAQEVRVLQEKLVAGFNAVVLEATSTAGLVKWLKDHGYVFSPAVEAWAKPYVEAGWKITALKIAKAADGKANPNVSAAALRLSFKTDRPLFPYREPDFGASAALLGADRRLLRIYFLAEARYQGELSKEDRWTGQVAWADKLNAEDRKQALKMLKLPETTGPTEWWLTEFEDYWPYRVAPADVYFAGGDDQSRVKRPPIIEYVLLDWPADVTVYAIAAVLILPPLLRRVRASNGGGARRRSGLGA